MASKQGSASTQHKAQEDTGSRAHKSHRGEDELTEEQKQMLTRRKMMTSAWSIIIGVILVVICLLLGIH